MLKYTRTTHTLLNHDDGDGWAEELRGEGRGGEVEEEFH